VCIVVLNEINGFRSLRTSQLSSRRRECGQRMKN